MGTRTAITAALAAWALLAGLGTSPAAAAAPTFTAAFSDGPRHEVETRLSIRGTSDVPRFVSAFVPPRDGACDAVWFQLRMLVDAVPVPAGDFAVSTPVAFEAIGRDTLCVTVHDTTYGGLWNDADVAAKGEQPVDVANARATVAIDARLEGRRYLLTVTGDAEKRRFLVARSWRGAACGTYGTGTDLHASLIPVGPGPFSKTFELDSYGKAAEERAVCATVESPVGAFGPDDRLVPDAKAEQVLRWPTVVDPPPYVPPPRHEVSDDVTVGAPVDGATGVALNPTFDWAASLKARRYPAAADTLVLRRVRAGKVTPLLRLDGKTFRLQDEKAGMEMYDSGATATIAEHRLLGYSVSVQLRRGLPPGVYEWTVERRGRVPSPPRRFTVVAPRIADLRTSARRKANGRSWDPGWTFLTLRSASYVRYEFAYRHGGGRWTAYRIPARRSAQQSAVIGWSCRRPGGTFRWRLTAIDGWGTTRTAAGSTPNVTRADCDRMRGREAAERRAAERRRAAEERRRRAREEQRRRAEERRRAAERERFERNCQAVGGSPVWIDEGGGWRRLICRAPFGGELPVPGFDY